MNCFFNNLLQEGWSPRRGGVRKLCYLNLLSMSCVFLSIHIFSHEGIRYPVSGIRYPSWSNLTSPLLYARAHTLLRTLCPSSPFLAQSSLSILCASSPCVPRVTFNLFQPLPYGPRATLRPLHIYMEWFFKWINDDCSNDTSTASTAFTVTIISPSSNHHLRLQLCL